MTQLTSARLRFEPVDDCHFEGLQAMNRRPEVMRYISGAPETPEQTRAAIARVQARWAEWGYSWWALIHLESGRLCGAACVQHLGGQRANPLELGWRLHPDFWGQGLASEAARRLAAFAFEALQAPEVVAIRHPDNQDSCRVMDALGMTLRGIEPLDGEDLCVHVLSRTDWLAQNR